MRLFFRGELIAAMLAIVAVFGCLWLEAKAEESHESEAEALITAEAPDKDDCLDFAVRIHEDNGWSGAKKINPPRFYCGKGYDLDAEKDGLIICRCIK